VAGAYLASSIVQLDAWTWEDAIMKENGNLISIRKVDLGLSQEQLRKIRSIKVRSMK
jgi:hypothetical protein